MIWGLLAGDRRSRVYDIIVLDNCMSSVDDGDKGAVRSNRTSNATICPQPPEMLAVGHLKEDQRHRFQPKTPYTLQMIDKRPMIKN